MHKVIKINESQVNRLFTIMESSGVNDAMFKVADLIARQISFSDIFKILSDTSLIEDWHDGYDTTYDNEVEYEGETYNYSVFYDEGGDSGFENGNTDGDTVSVNFYIIERVIAEYNEMKRINYTSYDEDEDDDFDAYLYSQEALYGCPGAEYDIYKVVCPVVLHELTHNLDKNGNPMDRLWIKPVNRYNEEDVRDYMYIFSTSEMNSRVASAPAILMSIIKLEHAEKDLKDVINSKNPRTKQIFFSQNLMPSVFDSPELKINHMGTLVGLLENYNTHFPISAEYLEDCLKSKPTTFVNSLFFHLAINEPKLYKRSNARQVLKLYATNPREFELKVIQFYKDLFEQYKKRIYKACWYVYDNYPWDVQEMDDDYERTTMPWHKKIWGEDT